MRIIRCFALLAVLFMLSSCNRGDAKISDAIISVNQESDYTSTFSELDLGIVFDYLLTIDRPENQLIEMWVESYQNGELEKEPLVQLIMNIDSQPVKKERFGLGIIKEDQSSQAFLYGPGVKASSVKFEKVPSQHGVSSWGTTIGEKAENLQMNQTYLLGVYVESHSNSMHAYNYEDPEDIQTMIKENKRVYLLKVIIHEQ